MRTNQGVIAFAALRQLDQGLIAEAPMARYIRALAHNRSEAHATKARPPLDLFGDLVITDQDITQWLVHIGHDTNDIRRAWYVRAYNVTDKIRAAMTAGHWPPPD